MLRVHCSNPFKFFKGYVWFVGIHMIAVAAEMKADNLYLKGIASDPAQANIIAVDRFSDLLPRVSDIAATTCNGRR